MITVVSVLLAGVVAYYLGLRQSRFERLEEKRAEVLAELSGLLFEVEDRYRKWYAPSLRGGHDMSEIKGKVKERGSAAIESLNDLTRCYHRNVAWLDPDVATPIGDAITELQEMLFEYGKVGVANTHFQISEKGVEAAKAMGDRIPEIRKELVDEFREILRPSAPWSRFLAGSRNRKALNEGSSTPPPD